MVGMCADEGAQREIAFHTDRSSRLRPGNGRAAHPDKACGIPRRKLVQYPRRSDADREDTPLDIEARGRRTALPRDRIDANRTAYLQIGVGVDGLAGEDPGHRASGDVGSHSKRRKATGRMLVRFEMVSKVYDRRNGAHVCASDAP